MRVGTVPFLNVKPFVGYLEQSCTAAAPVTLTYAPPAALAPLLLENRIDAGFVAAADFWQHRTRWVQIEEYGVACRGPVASVLLCHDAPLDRLQRIVADERSATSVAVLRILARYHWHICPEIVCGDVLAAQRQEACLVIGDQALGLVGMRPALDLGEAWFEFAKLPFVFGVWVARDEGTADALRALLRAGLDWFEAHFDSECARHARRLGLPLALVRDYLSQRIVYRLGTEEHQGLATFGRWLDRERAESIRPSHASATWWTVRRPRSRRRITPQEGIVLLEEGNLLDLGRRAHERRCELHNPNEVTYVIDRNVNYTNVCVARCSFCAFYRPVGDPEGYVLDREALFKKVAELVAAGGTTLLLQGGHNPQLSFSFYLDLCRELKKRFPTVQLHGFSPPEIVFFSRLFRLPTREIITALRDAGLDSVPGGGAEILTERIRKEIAGRKTRADEWIDIMRQVHQAGMTSTATMMFGHVETAAERIEHLERVRRLQDETGGFTAFIPWTYQPGNTALGGEEVGGVEYLKTLAVARLFLDNFLNIQSSIVTQGSKIGQISLYFGANDLGGVMLEENVVRAAGVSNCVSIDEFLALIRAAGFAPVQRDTYYNRIAAAPNAARSHEL